MNKTQDSIGIKGKVKVIVTKSLPTGFWAFVWYKLILGKKTGEFLYEIPFADNLIMFAPNYGRDLILRRLASDNTYSLNINYADIGTGSTTPAITDTALTTASARGAMSYSSISSNVASLQFFFSDAALSNTTYYEFGTFVDGTSSTGTGRIFNHALFSSAYVKVAGQDTTVQVDFTIT